MIEILLLVLPLTFATTIDQAARVLAKDLAPQVKTRPAPVTLYSYHHRSPAPPTADLIRDKVARLFEAYVRPPESYVTGNGQKSTAVPGFYVALDPAASADYGGKGEDWRLIEFSVKRLRYLELSRSMTGATKGEHYRYPLASQTIATLHAAGCEMTGASYLFMMPNSAACGRIAIATLELLRVDALLYGFEAALGKVCVNQPGSALLFVDTRWMSRAQITEYGAGSTGDLARLRKLLDLGRPANPEVRAIIDRRNWPDVAPAGERETLEWAKENLFGCGDVPTDAFSPRANELRDLSSGM